MRPFDNLGCKMYGENMKEKKEKRILCLSINTIVINNNKKKRAGDFL